MPFSRLTFGTLVDMGYTVRWEFADDYALPPVRLLALSAGPVPNVRQIKCKFPHLE